jgi:hypothetical protein
VLEGDDATTDTASPTVRLGNYHQISDKVARVSGTQRAVEHAGRDDELDYQVSLKGKELKRDMETIAAGATRGAMPARRYAARCRSVLSWILTNTSKGTNGSDPTVGRRWRLDPHGRHDPCVHRSAAEGRAAVCWTSTAASPTRSWSAASTSSSSRPSPAAPRRWRTGEVQEDRGVGRRVRVDFGTLKVVPNRFQRTRDVLVLEMDMWALGTLPGRNMVSTVLAKTGDSDRKQILTEYTLEARNEKTCRGLSRYRSSRRRSASASAC